MVKIKDLGGVCVSRKPLATQMVWTPPINPIAEDLYQYRDYHQKIVKASGMVKDMIQQSRRHMKFDQPIVASEIGMAATCASVFDSLPSYVHRNRSHNLFHQVSKEVLLAFKKHFIENNPDWYYFKDNVVHVNISRLLSLPNHDESR